MKQTVCMNSARAALGSLGIRYRELQSRSGYYYFCTNTAGGRTFALEQKEDGTFRLWRFVGAAARSKAGMLWEYRSPDNPHAVIGMEVTEEGDVSLYVRQIIARDDPHSETRILQMIEGFTELISHFPVRITSL